MFLFIPLVIASISLSTICFIAWRKFPYLKKISEPSAPAAGEYSFANFFSDLFPEVVYRCKKLDFEAYKNSLLKELEKLLRRLRVISLKIDRLTNSLLWKIKTESNKNGAEKAVEFKIETKTISPKKENLAENLKREEQQLIIEIAKNPKNPELYKKLAEVYIALKNFPDAEESLEAALELDPEDQKVKEKLEEVKKNLPT